MNTKSTPSAQVPRTREQWLEHTRDRIWDDRCTPDGVAGDLRQSFREEMGEASELAAILDVYLAEPSQENLDKLGHALNVGFARYVDAIVHNADFIHDLSDHLIRVAMAEAREAGENAEYDRLSVLDYSHTDIAQASEAAYRDQVDSEVDNG